VLDALVSEPNIFPNMFITTLQI